MQEDFFEFKQFKIYQDKSLMKVGTDGVLLGAWADISHSRHILDIGAGSGVIAIMLAQRAPEGMITAVEIDEQTAEQAKENMAASPFSERLRCISGSIQDFSAQSPTKFDLIVSNPPFFTGGTFSHSHSRNSIRHTVKLSHTDLLRSVNKLLDPNGRFCVILPYIEGLRFIEIATQARLHLTRSLQVISKEGKPIERLLLQFEYTQKPMEEASLVILHPEGRNNWTDDYIRLTGDFYLDKPR